MKSSDTVVHKYLPSFTQKGASQRCEPLQRAIASSIPKDVEHLT